jgi:hypothetical protein
MALLQITLRDGDKTEADPMKLTLSLSLCALLFAGAGLIGGHAPAAGSPANAMTSVVADPIWDKSVKGRTDQFL